MRWNAKCRLAAQPHGSAETWVYVKTMVRRLLLTFWWNQQEPNNYVLCNCAVHCHDPLLAPSQWPRQSLIFYWLWLFVIMFCTYSMLPNQVVFAFWKGYSVNAAICLKCVHPEASWRSTWRTAVIFLKPRSLPMDLCWICLRRPSVRQSVP